MDKPEDERTMPKWSPPKPTVQECILELINVMYDDEKSTFNDDFNRELKASFSPLALSHVRMGHL